jgi:hypothetical protein
MSTLPALLVLGAFFGALALAVVLSARAAGRELRERWSRFGGPARRPPRGRGEDSPRGIADDPFQSKGG